VARRLFRVPQSRANLQVFHSGAVSQTTSATAIVMMSSKRNSSATQADPSAKALWVKAYNPLFLYGGMGMGKRPIS
jgi:chromosomal replication initiation ATPase DnaA